MTRPVPALTARLPGALVIALGILAAMPAPAGQQNARVLPAAVPVDATDAGGGVAAERHSVGPAAVACAADLSGIATLPAELEAARREVARLSDELVISWLWIEELNRVLAETRAGRAAAEGELAAIRRETTARRLAKAIETSAGRDAGLALDGRWLAVSPE
jgi:hypothetical protein